MARKIKVLRLYLRTFSWQYLIQKSNSLYALDRQTKGQEKSHHDQTIVVANKIWLWVV